MLLDRFHIIDSTLREGEQFAAARFTTAQKVQLAQALDAFGVEYIEVTNPVASPGSFADCRTLAGLGLRARVIAHTRCHLADVERALEAGVHGVSMVIGVSPHLRQFSHGKSVEEIIELAREVLTFARRRAPDVELRFSTEDSFRSDETDLVRIYGAVAALGVVDRVGVADTVGVATPAQVHQLVACLRREVDCDIEFHGHNDTGCAIANALAALEAGATHVNTTVLGIGERNGITSLGGLIARLYTLAPEEIRRRYRLQRLRDLDTLVADMVGVPIPFNNYITGASAFSHKAGIHAKAVLNNPATYEALDPHDFGLTRQVLIGHRLTGWHAVRDRAAQLGLALSEDEIRAVTAEIKALADGGPLASDAVDALLRRRARQAADGATAVGA